MENETKNDTTETVVTESVKRDYMIPVSIVIAGVLIASSVYYFGSGTTQGFRKIIPEKGIRSQIEMKVLPSEGVILPVRWGDLGMKMVSVGVIDKEKFESLYTDRGGLGEEDKKLLGNATDGQVKITENNSGFLLNLFWALGLGTENDILKTGPISDPRYGGSGNFASTGGWTLAEGNLMDHYNRHPFITLTTEQQKLVEKVSKHIYRPCCNNATYFPDCNHGMAMLGLLELMASQGVSEQDMYKTALAVNAYWFPDTYLTIAQYFASKGIDWSNADPKDILGENYSSSSGYEQILNQVRVPQKNGGSDCGVEQKGTPVKKSNGGCGV